MVAALRRVELLEDRSVGGRAFCTAYTEMIDMWLQTLFVAGLPGSDAVDEPTPGGPTSGSGRSPTRGVALVALGGHGRGELCPQSDLDLLLVTTRGRAADAIADGLWYPIWDARLKLGHSVRTLNDTLILASEDLNTATALLSARHIAGDLRLTEELVERSRSNWRHHGRRWVDSLAQSVTARHYDQGDIAFTLEPNLKEGRGGMRDVHALRWAAMAGAAIEPDVLSSLDVDYDTLLDARVELHRVTERHVDRLLLQEQDSVAAALGQGDADAMMSRVAKSARAIAWLSDEAWFDISPPEVRQRWRRRRAERQLDEGIALVDGRVQLIDQHNRPTDAHILFRVALQASIQRTRISPATLSLLAEAPDLPEPWDERARRLFCDFLLTGASLVQVVETLDHAELWSRLIHEWDKVRSLHQRNALHRHTVDRHLLECVAHAVDLAGLTPAPDLLVVAALLHDIGKGYAGDHSRSGELLAEGIARRMGFTPGAISTIGFLVRNHLLLSRTATRRDLDDPSTVQSVATIVETPERLSLLCALSEADGKATGTWTPWTAGLVDQLAERILASWDQSMSALGPVTVSVAETVVGDVAPTTITVNNRADGSTAQPVLTSIGAEGDSLTVVCTDRPGVICRVAGVLALHGLDVMEATAKSDGNKATDHFKVRLTAAGWISWDPVVADVERALDGRLAIEARLSERSRSHTRRHDVGRTQLAAGVRVDDDATARATMVEVVGPNRIGLLYQLTRALGEFDLDIRSAKINTLDVDVVDTFSLTDRNGRSIEDPLLRGEIHRALSHVLDSG